MKRYHSTLGPFMLTRLSVIALGAQFSADIVAAEGRAVQPTELEKRAARLVSKIRERVRRDRSAPAGIHIDLTNMTPEREVLARSLMGDAVIDNMIQAVEPDGDPGYVSGVDQDTGMIRVSS